MSDTSHFMYGLEAAEAIGVAAIASARAETEFWAISNPGSGGDEVGLEPYECPEPWDCYCIIEERETGIKTRCGYRTKDAQSHVVSYYRARSEYFESLSADKFLEAMGYPVSHDAQT